MSGSMDIVKKESWFWPGEEANNLSRPKSKKEVRARAMAKEEAKIKARARTKREVRGRVPHQGVVLGCRRVQHSGWGHCQVLFSSER